MKISTKGRYGLKAMIDIATNSESGNCVNLKNISKRQGIPENYLEQLMSLLKKSGYVKSIRGATGGYLLGKDASDISVGDILRVLEGSLAPSDCVDKDLNSCNSSLCEKCVTKGVWEKILTNLNDVVDSISLESLVKEEQSII